MLETLAKTKQCVTSIRTCLGGGCVGWVFDDQESVRWKVIHGSSDDAMLPAVGPGVTATVTRPGDFEERLWQYTKTNSSYDLWDYFPTGGLDGHCMATNH